MLVDDSWLPVALAIGDTVAAGGRTATDEFDLTASTRMRAPGRRPPGLTADKSAT